MRRAASMFACYLMLPSSACVRTKISEPTPESLPTEAAQPEDGSEPASTQASTTELEPEPDAAVVEAQKQSLAAAVREQLPTLTSCYEDQLQHDRTLAGKLRVTITIEAGGWVSEVMFDEDGVGSEAVRACVDQRMREWAFIEVGLDEATELSFSVNFTT